MSTTASAPVLPSRSARASSAAAARRKASWTKSRVCGSRWRRSSSSASRARTRASVSASRPRSSCLSPVRSTPLHRQVRGRARASLRRTVRRAAPRPAGVRVPAQNAGADDRPRHRPRPRQHRLRRGAPPRRAAGRARRRRDRHVAAHRARAAPGGRPRARRAGCWPSTGPTRSRSRTCTSARNAPSAFAVGQARGVVMLAAGQPACPASTTRPSRSRARCAGTAARPRSRSAAWSRRCWRCPRRRAPTTPPTRSPWPSATPTARRSPRALAVPGVIALLRGEVAVRRPDHVVLGPPAASATRRPCRPRRCATSPPSASPAHAAQRT